MKFEKWIENAGKLAEKVAGKDGRGIIYQNAPGGLYFAPRRGEYIVFKDGGTYEGPNVPCGSLATFWNKYAEVGTIADRRRGVLAGVYPVDAKKKVSVFTNAAGVSAVVNEKFVNLFPKDALFYVSGQCNPVAVGLMDGGALHIIAIVCPINAELSRIEYAEAV